MCWFLWMEENRRTRRKNLGARREPTTNSTLHETTSTRIEPGSQRWKASAYPLHQPCSLLHAPFPVLPPPCSLLHAPSFVLPTPCSLLRAVVIVVLRLTFDVKVFLFWWSVIPQLTLLTYPAWTASGLISDAFID